MYKYTMFNSNLEFYKHYFLSKTCLLIHTELIHTLALYILSSSINIIINLKKKKSKWIPINYQLLLINVYYIHVYLVLN